MIMIIHIICKTKLQIYFILPDFFKTSSIEEKKIVPSLPIFPYLLLLKMRFYILTKFLTFSILINEKRELKKK